MPSSSADADAPGGFAALGLTDVVVAAVAALGYEEPTPVQRQTIPLILAGGDLLTQAATGTGKTAAFALPLIQRLRGGAEPGASKKRGRPPTRGLVLVPTRELAMQVAEAVHKYSRGSGLTVVPVYGGAPMMQQIRALDRGADIVVGTPGRVLDHLRRQSLALDQVETLVLDEADEMLDMGFAEDLDAILEATPETRQTALFSATMPPRLRSIAERHLNQPQRIQVAREKVPAGKIPRVRQVVYFVPRAHKTAALQRVLDMESPASALVFCRTRLEVDTLVETLNAHGYRAEAIHGGMQQRQREAVMARFRSAKADLLIATDVAARGLDVDRISHVLNYDIPHDPESYVHRIGRTGRAGRSGTALLFVTPRERHLLNSIERVTRQKLVESRLPSVDDVNAQRVEKFRDSITSALNAPGIDLFRKLIEGYEQDNDVPMADIAAALALQSRDGEEFLMTEPPPEKRRERADRPPREDGSPRKRREVRSDLATYRIAVGKRHKVMPGAIVGAIANEGGLQRGDFGHIDIRGDHSLVELPVSLSDRTLDSLRGTRISGKLIELSPVGPGGGDESQPRSKPRTKPRTKG